MKFTILEQNLITLVEVYTLKSSKQLVFNNRIINAKRNSFGRYDVKESGKFLIRDSFDSLDFIRLMIASGKV